MNPIELAKQRSDCHPNNIDTLVRIVNETRGIPGDIAECGSYKCGATIAMAAAAPEKKAYAFDLFGGLPYGDGVGFENFADVDFKEILEVTAPFQNIVLLKGLHEDTIPKFAKHRSFPLSLIFVDSDHYSSHKVCLSHLWPLLSSGGVVVFHDWGLEGVQRAIRETIDLEPSRAGMFESPNLKAIWKK